MENMGIPGALCVVYPLERVDRVTPRKILCVHTSTVTARNLLVVQTGVANINMRRAARPYISTVSILSDSDSAISPCLSRLSENFSLLLSFFILELCRKAVL